MNTTTEDSISIKAKELLIKFTQNQYSGCVICSDDFNDKELSAKECAIICVSEIISQLKNIEKSLLTMKVNLDPIIKFNEQVLEKIKFL